MTTSFVVSEPLSRRTAESTIVSGAPEGQWLKHPEAPNAISLPRSAQPFRNDTTRLDTVIAVIRDPPPRELHRGDWVKLVHDPMHFQQKGGMVYPKVEWCPDNTTMREWMKDCEHKHALAGAIASPDIVPCGDEWTDTYGTGPEAMQHIGVMLTGINDLRITDAELADAPDNMMYEQGMHTVNHRCITLGRVPPETFGRNIPVRALIV